MPNNITFKNLQDSFLNDIVKNRELVEINLINGIVLTGKIINFDNFSILIESNNRKSLLYKHSVSYIFEKKNKKIKK